jgi:hypothetical protein
MLSVTMLIVIVLSVVETYTLNTLYTILYSTRQSKYNTLHCKGKLPTSPSCQCFIKSLLAIEQVSQRLDVIAPAGKIVIKLFKSIFYRIKYLISGKLFHPTLIFPCQVGSYQSGVSFSVYFSSGDKHSSLFRKKL